MNQRKMVNYIVREGKCLQYPGRELSLEEKKQRLYHYTSFNSFVRIWLTQTLKFGVVTDMNDMFEHNFSSQCHSINAIKHLNSYHEEKKKYKQISLTMDYDSYTQGCMSPMMWGLYGDKGKGVCIEFDYIKLMKHLKRGMLHDAICYTPQLPEPPVLTKEAASDWEAFFESKQKELLFTKHDCWSKENEYRIVSKKKDDYLKINGAIKAIYMTKCKSCECECIEELLKNNEDVYFRCVYQDSMPQIGTFLNICDVEQHKEAYKK